MTLDFEALLRAQHALNTLAAGEGYLDRKLPYYRKAWAECGEALDYLNDNWWKKGKLDADQLFLELIDILHFTLSEALNAYGVSGIPKAAAAITKMADEANSRPVIYPLYQEVDGFHQPFIDGLEYFVKASIDFSRCLRGDVGNIDVGVRYQLGMMFYQLFSLFRGADWSHEDIETIYLSKFTLNIFRQHNGYKDGTYVKLWDGQLEDNHWLMLEVTELKPLMEGLPFVNKVEMLYQNVSLKYWNMVKPEPSLESYMETVDRHIGFIRSILSPSGLPQARA